MILRFKHTGLLLSLLAVTGLFISMNHYHAESLSCLNEIEHHHIEQDESLCAICTLVSEFDFTQSFEITVQLPQVDIVIIEKLDNSILPFIHSNNGRSPPFLA